jgi:hypothetical protein
VSALVILALNDSRSVEIIGVLHVELRCRAQTTGWRPLVSARMLIGAKRESSSSMLNDELFLNSKMRPDSDDPARMSVSQYQNAHRSHSPSGKPRPSSPMAC